MVFDWPGLFSRSEALAAGWTDDHLRRARSEGVLVTIRRGYFVRTDVYSSLDAPARHLLLAKAVYTESGENTVFSHVSAAVLHGMETWSIPLDKATFTVSRSYAGKRGRLRTLHSSPLKDSVVEVGGFSVTSAPRTLGDLARTLPLVPAVCIGDHALRTGLVTLPDLLHELDLGANRTGIARARQAVSFMSERTLNAGETRSRMHLDNIPLPTPLIGRWVYDDDESLVGRAPFLFPAHGVVGIYAGAGLHGADPVADALHDELFRQRLRDLGWLVVTWNWADLSSPRELTVRIAQSAVQAARMPSPRGYFVSNLA